MEYYVIEFLINHCSFFTFWYSDGIDRFYTKGNNLFIMTDYKEVLRYADENNMLISNEHTVIECDYILNWNMEIDIIGEDILNFWNLSHDLAYSIGETFIGDSDYVTNIYDKLFKCCKEPMLILEERVDTTKWNIKEKAYLLSVIKDGIRILKKIVPIPELFTEV